MLNNTIQTDSRYNDGNLTISKDVRNTIRGITSTAVSHTWSENTLTSVRKTGCYQTRAVFIAPLHYHALRHMKISLMKSKHKITVTSLEAMEELTWWYTELQQSSCSPIVQQEASVVIESDVSMKGLGAVYQGARVNGL